MSSKFRFCSSVQLYVHRYLTLYTSGHLRQSITIQAPAKPNFNHSHHFIYSSFKKQPFSSMSSHAGSAQPPTLASFSINPKSPIIVSYPASSGLTQETILNFPAFHNWLTTLQHSISLQKINPSHPFQKDPYTLRQINIQSVDFFGSGGNRRIGFLKLQAVVKNSAGETLPGSVFLRGGSVSILVILEPEDLPETETDEEKDQYRYILLTVQPRIPAGSLSFVEIPAGMIDDSTGNVISVAINELKEECGIEVPSTHSSTHPETVSHLETARTDTGLIDLTKLAHISYHDSSALAQHWDDEEKLEDAVYPSPGGSDEFIKILAYKHKVKKETLHEWVGKLTGNRDEGEKITLKICKFDELWKATRDGKSLAAWGLYMGLRKEGKI